MVFTHVRRGGVVCVLMYVRSAVRFPILRRLMISFTWWVVYMRRKRPENFKVIASPLTFTAILTLVFNILLLSIVTIQR